MIATLGSSLIRSSRYTRELTTLVAQAVKSIATSPFRVRDTIHQFYFIANQSVFIICVCVSFAAVVTIIESSFHMKIVIQNDSLVPGFAAMLILRELGSVVMALLMTSRVGAGIAAEVGTMKITEQIDALKMLGIDPIRFIVVPRLIASTAAGFVLSIIANLICLYCAMLVSTMKLGSSFGGFLAAMNAFVGFQDLVFASIKGAVFGAVIPIFACFYGFRCRAGAEGVGLATTNSVVATSIAIIILDFVLTYV
ncbi:MAG: ABC transporter permease, partial [Bdellovibrionota bacterium]